MTPGLYRLGDGREKPAQFVPREEMDSISMPGMLVFMRLPVGECLDGYYCENCDRVFAEFSVLTDGTQPNGTEEK